MIRWKKNITNGKKNMKRLIALLLTVFTLISVIPFTVSAAQMPFKDVKENHPFYKEIIRSAKCNLVGGYEDGTFRPAKMLTRAQAAKILYMMIPNK